jgi:hypothetical protein
MSEIKVTGCSDCPFFNDGANYEYRAKCQHPANNTDERIEVHWGKPITPDWCPLKKEPITIIFNA